MTSASSRFRSTIVALAALALGATGCGSTNACKSGTLLVTLTFDPATAAATQLVVDVSAPGASSRQHQLDHQAGMTTGTIEIDFPDGYTAGQTVQVTVTASSSGGTAIGSATGSVTLASGCSTLTLHFGGSDAGGPTGTGGASGGAGGKSTSGTGGANAGGAGGTGGAAGSLGGTGTGGTGTGGTGTGGTGTGGTGTGGTGTGGTGTGGTGTGGAGGAACVFTSAEDCFNGIDDDCNGKTDCEDPACAPTTECVAAPGSTFQAGVEAATATTTCPSNFTGGETALNEGFNVSAATSCTGCSCTASTSCSISLYSYATASSCNADTAMTGGTLVGTLNSSTMCVEPAAGLTAAGYRFSGLTKSDSACAASGTPTLPATSWTTQKKFCAANRLGGGCSPGYVCAPKLAQLTDHCVRADGNLTCPAGYSAQTDTWYKGMTDSRACAACGCGTETPGDCTKELLSGTPYARSVAFWPNSFGQCSTSGGTSFNVSTTPGSQTCCPLQCEASSCGASGIACGNFGYEYPPLQASCPPTSVISGAATPTGPETVCCL